MQDSKGNLWFATWEGIIGTMEYLCQFYELNRAIFGSVTNDWLWRFDPDRYRGFVYQLHNGFCWVHLT